MGKYSSNALSNKCNIQESKSNESIFVSPLSCDVEESVLTDMLASYIDEEVTTITSYEEQEVCFDEVYEASALDPCTIIPSYEEEQLLQKWEDFNISETIEEEGLKYIAGYVTFRFKSKDKTLGIETRQLETTGD